MEGAVALFPTSRGEFLNYEDTSLLNFSARRNNFNKTCWMADNIVKVGRFTRIKFRLHPASPLIEVRFCSYRLPNLLGRGFGHFSPWGSVNHQRLRREAFECHVCNWATTLLVACKKLTERIRDLGHIGTRINWHETSKKSFGDSSFVRH